MIRKSFSILFLWLCAMVGMAQTDGYDPVNPPNPDAPAATYMLATSVQPVGAGSSNVSGSNFTAGSSVYVYTYNNNGYVFKHWTDGTNIVSTNSSFYYTMPASNAHLTAVYEYDPAAPDNPSGDYTLPHYLNLKASPSQGGSFNYNSSQQFKQGQQLNLYAYANSHYTFKHWEYQGEVVSTNYYLNFTMPDINAELVAVFEYNPTNPQDPGTNFWNAETGELIIDAFQTDNLYNAIYNVTGGNTSTVQTLIVNGKVSNYDIGNMASYPFSVIDFSRCAGATSVPSWSFENNSTLTSISLPSSITNIEYYAFSGCQSLTSVSCYATVPPTLGTNVFNGIKDQLVVFVPAASIDLYQEAAGWKDLTLLPLQSQVNALEVNLPAGSEDGRFKNMFIELVNSNSGQRMRYVVSDRTAYTFQNLMHDTKWNVYVKNAKGQVLGELLDIEMKTSDRSVTFQSLIEPQTIKAIVLNPDGKDITDQVAITWMNPDGSFLGKEASVSGILPIDNTSVVLRATLPQALAMQYKLLADSTYVVQTSQNVISQTLKALPTAKLKGTVRDVVTNAVLGGATVTISQTLNGKYSKAFTATANNLGVFTIDAFDAPTSVTAVAEDYISKTETYEALTLENGVATLEDIALKSINGATITTKFTYTPSVLGGTAAETQSYYADYQNVAYTIRDITTGVDIKQFNIQYPQIVLLEDVALGDSLMLTATSKTGAFMPVVAKGKVDEMNRMEVTFPVKQLGQISATFVSTENAAVNGILYDSKGKFLKNGAYSDAALSFKELTDGDYTLVTMGNSKLFNTIYDLGKFTQAGLVEGTDYVATKVTVQSGVISAVKTAYVPFFDESKLYYTGDNTSFTVNKTQITAGNYLTINSRVDFKSVYANDVSNVRLIVDLPDACSLVDNSVMVGSALGAYISAAGRVTIPVENISDRIRFCVIPTAGGDYAPSAYVQFTYNDQEVTQPIGQANFSVKDLSISVPNVVAKATVPVSGMAVSKSLVEIYDGEKLIGQTAALANGAWYTTCELENPTNLSKHQIYAKVVTPQGLQMQSETKECMYDRFALEAKSVKMSFFNGWLRKTIEVNFDLQNKTIDASSYMFYTGTDITFIADLTNNDPSVIQSVTIKVYTDRNNWRNLEATYNKNMDRWVAVEKFESDELPIGVKVEFDAEHDYLPDMQEGLADALNIEDLVKEYQKNLGLIEQLFGQLDENSTDDDLRAIAEQLEIEFTEEDVTDENLEGKTEAEIEEYLDGIYDQIVQEDDELLATVDGFSAWFDLQKAFEDTFGNGTTYKLSNCDGLTSEQLLADGYEETLMADNTTIYTKATEETITFVNFVKNVVVTITLPKEVAQLYGVKGKVSAQEFAQKVQEVYKAIKTTIDTINSVFDEITKTAQKPIEAIEDAIKQLERRVGQVRNWKNHCTVSKTKWWKWRLEEFRLQKALASARLARNICKPIVKGLLKCLPVVDYISTLYDCYTDADKIWAVYNTIPDPCKDDQANATACQVKCYGALTTVATFAIADVLGNFTADAEIVGGALASVATAGTSLTAVAWGIVQKVAVQIGKIVVKNLLTDGLVDSAKKQIATLKCNKKKDKDKDDDKPYPTIDPIHDPSGYVYEGVPSNRLQGVTATAYYKETGEDMYGDPYEKEVLWDAEEYAQENPLFTDEFGMYAWDVPQGLWRVKFEKEGYQTTYSEWLPVPPPQLDVNIAMVQDRQPEVKEAKAYEDGVEVEFDKYMLPENLTTDNIIVKKNGEKVEDGSIKLLDEEDVNSDSSQKLASKVKFVVPENTKLLSTDEVTLVVTTNVKSYTGAPLQETYTQTFDVEKAVTSIAADEQLSVLYEGTRQLQVSALPADAAVGKTLRIRSLSTLIANFTAEGLTKQEDGSYTIVLDETGQVMLTVSGELPGSTALQFSVDGTSIEGQTLVKVQQAASLTTPNPIASRASGSAVYRGTLISLSCENENAKIWYTLDGTCPCETATALVYSKPIAINDDKVTIKAMAQAEGLEESEVVTFEYTAKQNTQELALSEGWTWISHNVANNLAVSSFPDKTLELKSQTRGVIRDEVLGLFGNLQELAPTEAYKIKMSEAVAMPVNGDAFNATKGVISLAKGWNWIGYPLDQIMTPDEALKNLSASEGDMLVGLSGSADYVNGKWVGNLEAMIPGLGYMLKLSTADDLLYNTAIVSNAASQIRGRLNINRSPWSVDEHRYSNVMPMRAQLFREETPTEDDEFTVAAFSGTECRGIGKCVQGVIFMNVHGEGAEDITFLAAHNEKEYIVDIQESMTFTSDAVGSFRSPYALHLGDETVGVAERYAQLGVWPTLATTQITVSLGGRPIDRLTLTSTDGKTVRVKATGNAQEVINVTSLPAGIYIVAAQSGGEFFYKKIMKVNN